MRSQGISIRFAASAVVSALLSVCFIIPAPVRAQVAGATLSGTVTDASGAVIPNAQITIKNVATGVAATIPTNADGLYTAPNLLPGTYDVKVSASGFQTHVQSGITLTVGAQQVLNVTMQVGQTTQTVEVTGQAAAVQLATSALSANVNSTTVRELPLNGRDWASLATLQPGVAQVRTQELITQVGSQARGLGTQMSIDGNRPTQNSYRLNGIIINDYSNAGPGSVLGANLGVDAIQEFTVLTNNYSAEYGYTSGGVINAITRSGTNQFHGSVFEFLRNSSLDAANFFDNYSGLTKSPFRRNQFGGSAGGPIKKDKVFIFGSYEGLRQEKGISTVSKTLSPAARSGILCCDTSGNTFTVPVNAEIQKFFTFYPLPNAGLIGSTKSPNTGNYAFSGAQTVPENYYTTRGDVKLSDKDSLNASWYYDHSSFSKPDNLNQVLDGFIVMRQGASLEETHVFSPGLVDTVRLGFNRSTGTGESTLSAINPAAADPSFGMFPGFFAPRITAPGLTTFTGGLRGQSVQNYTGQNFQIYDDALHTVGTHSLKFGGMLIFYQANLYAPFVEDGTSTFKSLSDLLQNIPFKASGPPNIAAITPHNNRTKIIAGYIEDDWKARPGLTLNLGLRYEMETIPSEVQDKIANLPTILTNPSGCTIASCPALSKVYFTSNPTTKNFEPRIGFSWDPFHDGKTAIRGGFGVFDALPLPYELVINNAQTSPYHVSATVTNPGQGTFPHGIPPLLVNPPDSTQSWNYVEQNLKRNYVYQWNFNIQRQISTNTSITLAYAGSRGIHNPFQTDELNTVFPYATPAGYLFPNPIGSGCLPGPPDCSGTDAVLGLPASFSANPTGVLPGLLINPNVAEIQSTIWQSKSWYNSFQAEVDKRMSHGVQMQASFTWSKTMDTTSGSFAGDNFAGDLTPTIPWWNLSLIKGLSDFNVGRNLVINGLWNVPTPKSLVGPAGWIARGWQLGGILSLSDGVPVWPLDGIEGDPAGQLNSEPMTIPDRVCSNLINPGNVNYISPNCFVNATAPSLAFYNASQPLGCDKSFAYPTCMNLFGNLGRNTVIGPGLANLDFSLVKDNHISRISESFDVQFRAEFFNILNRANFAPPVANLEAIDATGAPVPGFGQITSTQSPERQIQFALKIIW
jgi:Carboxypeptidase regulatory-like domain